MTEATAARSSRGHRVRELVCSYRTLRDNAGHVQDVATLALSSPRIAADTLGPLLAAELVEVFAVACLSARHQLLTWHVVSRGMRTSTPISIPDVFVPACLTPGTTGLIIVHNHPSGNPTPSADDARLTIRLCTAADALDMPLLDHLIVGDAGRYFSFRRQDISARRTLPRGAGRLNESLDGHHASRLCGSPRRRQGSPRRGDPPGFRP